MPKNNKNARVIRAARATKMKKGPAHTTKLHKKVNTWYNPASRTYWAKPKDTKKIGKSATEQSGMEFFRLLKEATDKAQRLQKMRVTAE